MDQREEYSTGHSGVGVDRKQRFAVSKARPAVVPSSNPANQPSPKQIKFEVAFCSGEDPEFPASELNTHSPQTRGWQSPPFCAYPQEIGLQFLYGEIQLSQLQILSHESKIATKIDVYVGRGESYDTCTFKRLGHLSLDDNERSEFAARELKSVYIGKQGQFLKLLIHKCHLNRHNIYNQAGIIAINVLGFELSQDQLAAQGGGEKVGYVAPIPGATNKHVPPLEDLALDMNFDKFTAQRMREINQAKERAVEEEEYELAKELKNAENFLKQIGIQLARLEAAKREAVQREEYDQAAGIKQEISALRGEIEAQTGHLLGPQTGRSRGTLPQARQTPRQHQYQQPEYHQHQHQQQPQYQSPPQQHLGGARQEFPGDNGYQHDDAFHNNNNNQHLSPPVQQQPNPIEDRPLPTLQGNPSPQVESARSLHENSINNNSDEPATDPAIIRKALANVPGVDELPEAEPLPVALTGEVAPLVDIFGDYLVRCLYSRTVRLRAAALTKMEIDLSSYNLSDMKTFSAFCTVVGLSTTDKIANIYLQGVRLLEMASTKASRGGLLKKSDVLHLFEQFMPTIVEKLGNNAARIREASSHSLMHLAGLKLIGSQFVAGFILKLLRPGKAMLWRQLLNRLKVLSEMIAEFRMSEESGLELENVMKLITANAGHIHPNSDVRECAKEVVLQAYAQVGDTVLPYLKDLRPKQMEEYELGFKQIEDGLGVKPAATSARRGKDDTPAKASARSSASKSSPSKKSKPKPKIPEQPDDTRHHDEGKDKPINININLNNAANDDQLEDSEEEEEPFTCQFCGRYDESFTDDALDLHYWRECAMLTSCPKCDQIIEVAMLNEHLLEECEKKTNHKQCPRCHEAIGAQYFDQHVKRAACLPAKSVSEANRCPLCHKDVHAGTEGWKQHILGGTGCPKNPRTKHLR